MKKKLDEIWVRLTSVLKTTLPQLKDYEKMVLDKQIEYLKGGHDLLYGPRVETWTPYLLKQAKAMVWVYLDDKHLYYYTVSYTNHTMTKIRRGNVKRRNALRTGITGKAIAKFTKENRLRLAPHGRECYLEVLKMTS